MRISLVIAAGLAFSAPAYAEIQPSQTTAAPSAAAAGQMLRSADNARLGRISRVNADGAFEVIVDTQVRKIPGTTISMAEGKFTTSLTKQQVVSLR